MLVAFVPVCFRSKELDSGSHAHAGTTSCAQEWYLENGEREFGGLQNIIVFMPKEVRVTSTHILLFRTRLFGVTELQEMIENIILICPQLVKKAQQSVFATVCPLVITYPFHPLLP